jgi:hypothetical protein
MEHCGLTDIELQHPKKKLAAAELEAIKSNKDLADAALETAKSI